MKAITLVLDSGFQPIRKISWQDTFRLLCVEKISVVKYYKDKIVHSAHKAWEVPAVVRLTTGYVFTKKKRVKYSKENVYNRDKGICQFCGKSLPKNNFTVDHIVPRSKGGTTSWENIVVSCFDCNQLKKDRSLDECGMTLIKKPTRPVALPYNDLQVQNIPEEWIEAQKEMGFSLEF